MSLLVSPVSDEKDLKEIYKLRYKVFCYEWGFEKPGNHPDGIVSDVYDGNALHFAVKNDMHKIVGAISLILHSPEGFPAEKYCELDINTDDIPRESIAEISRLVIHRDYRKRSEDKYTYGPDEDRRSIGNFNYPDSYAQKRPHYRRADDRYRPKGSRRANETFSEKRRRHEVLLNLYKAIYLESKHRRITHWYGVMTKGVVMLLNQLGFKFDVIGDPVDYHGIRTPYLGDVAKIEKEMVGSIPELYEEIARDLKVWPG